ncbi:MAG: hypothetical protein PVJ84_02790 [Desulfobacteraceae bacterium]
MTVEIIIALSILTAAVVLLVTEWPAMLAMGAVAALMLPVIMDIARRTGNPSSRLMMPLAYGSIARITACLRPVLQRCSKRTTG